MKNELLYRREIRKQRKQRNQGNQKTSQLLQREWFEQSGLSLPTVKLVAWGTWAKRD